MSRFWNLIQTYLDDTGVRETEFAHRMGSSPQTLNLWRERGLIALPERRLLEAVAHLTHIPYPDVLDAALTDIGYSSVIGKAQSSNIIDITDLVAPSFKADDTEVAARQADGYNEELRPTLQDLLRMAAADRGMSGRALGELASTHGWRLSHATVNQIASGRYKSRPSDQTIRAIAWLADVPDRVAYEAADLPVPNAAFRDELPDNVDSLSPKRRRIVLDLIRNLLETEELEHSRFGQTSGDYQRRE
ncbi:hypothetical protein [Nocardia sp. NPDC004711]